MFDPIGIAVNKNTNSPFYGRVFVGNDAPYYDNAAGIYKFNADGSPADEGGFSQELSAGPTTRQATSTARGRLPLREDDTVYINDWSAAAWCWLLMKSSRPIT